MLKEIILICDPGHGWGLVESKELRELGIAEKISSCSYLSRSGSIAALEEDCDLPIYLAALNKAGIDCTFEEQYHEKTQIRDWNCYSAARVSQC